ncbi:MAG: hypothetical protein MZV65_15600 [Chromatiales bacterium]|nr:hypothetical protein [Chromatiales bacterium]
MGRLFWFVSVPLERRFGHRTLTHSAVGARWPLAALAAPLWLDRAAVLLGGGRRLLVAPVDRHAERARASICSGPRRCGW